MTLNIELFSFKNIFASLNKKDIDKRNQWNQFLRSQLKAGMFRQRIEAKNQADGVAEK